MASVRIRRGLDVPISGTPEQVVEPARPVHHVAVSAVDYTGLRPKLIAREGDVVRRGQPLFEDRKNPGVVFTAPGAGKVESIVRGHQRALMSVIIELDEAEVAGDEERVHHQEFAAYKAADPASLDRAAVVALLVESGAWTALRARPHERTPRIDGDPAALFINAMDTRPLAASPDVALAGRMDDFHAGVAALAKLCDGSVHLCRAPGSKIDAGKAPGVTVTEFAGPHPSGLVGTHIHFLAPADSKHEIWHVDYADTAAIGHLFRTGRLDVRRVVALAGPAVKRPRLLLTRNGAALHTLVEGELADGDVRVISGDVLSGRADSPPASWLGPFHRQVSALHEGREREFIGWLKPGADKFSAIPAYLGGLLRGKRFAMTTSTNGEERAMVPIGMYEQVMPLDIMPTFLLRALQTGDIEKSEQLGALELAEEDLALCTFVCPGKIDHQGALRAMLDQIWKEG